MASSYNIFQKSCIESDTVKTSRGWPKATVTAYHLQIFNKYLWSIFCQIEIFGNV